LPPYGACGLGSLNLIPEDFDITDYQSVFEQAYDLGLKGCTGFRPNPVTGSVLSAAAGEDARPHCCDIDREAD
jgi:ribonucleoside-diphosphate reductase alpha chain